MVIQLKSPVKAIFLGNDEIVKAYLGNVIVYQKKKEVQPKPLVFNRGNLYNSGFFFNLKSKVDKKPPMIFNRKKYNSGNYYNIKE